MTNLTNAGVKQDESYSQTTRVMLKFVTLFKLHTAVGHLIRVYLIAVVSAIYSVVQKSDR